MEVLLELSVCHHLKRTSYFKLIRKAYNENSNLTSPEYHLPTAIIFFRRADIRSMKCSCNISKGLFSKIMLSAPMNAFVI